MVFILGTNYPERMLVRNMLTKLYGISQTSTTYFVRAPATHPSPKATEALTEPKPVGSYTSSRTTPWSYNILARNPTNSQSQNEHVKGAAEEGDLPLPSARKHSLLSRIMAKHYIHSQQTLGTLSHAQVQELAQTLTDLTIENDLRRRVQQDVRRLHEIGSYRGRRHAMNLPARGQRTRTQNATAIKLNKLNRHG